MTGQDRQSNPPGYWGVAFVAFVVRLVGLLKAGGGALVLLAAFGPQRGAGGLLEMYGLVLGAGLLAAGLLLYVAGELLVMARDIARNTFALRN